LLNNFRENNGRMFELFVASITEESVDLFNFNENLVIACKQGDAATDIVLRLLTLKVHVNGSESAVQC